MDAVIAMRVCRRCKKTFDAHLGSNQTICDNCGYLEKMKELEELANELYGEDFFSQKQKNSHTHIFIPQKYFPDR